jgi:restriction endonuclease Mrr
MISREKITDLTFKYVKGSLNQQERKILDEWLNNSDINRVRFEQRSAVNSIIADLPTLIEQGSDGISFKDKVVEEYFKDEKPSELEVPRIITDVRAINRSLLEHVQKDHKQIHNLNDREFEMLMAEFFIKQGYGVTLTPSTRDGGKDLILLDKKEFGNHIFFVECKKYALERPVGVGVIRSLHGAITGNATAGLVVSTSFFTKPAIDYTATIPHQMSLMDYKKLCELIQKLDGKR